MSKNDIGLLRSLIREMVNEAPYRSSQRVTLSGVSWSGTPSIRGTLLAGGMTGLIKLYDWASNICTVADENNNFPIKFSKEYSEQISKPRSGWSLDNYQDYKDSIAVQPSTKNVGKSDRENLTKFHVLIRDAGPLWPSDKPGLGNLGDNDSTKILTKIKEILRMYSGCANITLETVPTPTQTEYLEFLKNIGDLAENNFESNLFDQMTNMSVKFSDKKQTIEKDVTTSMKGSKKFWDEIKSGLK